MTENLEFNEQFRRGLQVRKQVLGSDYVEAAIADADLFSAPLQQLTTEYAWGAVWSREGLSLKHRSMITLAILTALDRPAELATHLRGAVRNGLSHEEIAEVLLQSAIYCGIPAAMEAIKIARQVLAAPEAE